MCKGVVYRYAQIEEGIRNAMGESAIYEDGYAKEHGQVLSLTGKGNYCGHNESAPDGQYAAFDGPQGKTCLHYSLSCVLHGQWRATQNQRHGAASQDIAEENEQNLCEFSLLEEPCCTGV